MLIHLFKIDEPKNKISKTLKNETLVNGNFRGSVEITAPTINLVGADYTDYNYCYIPDLNRYYFITNMIIERQRFLICDLEIDVLKSYESKIKNGRGNAIESEAGNKYVSEYVESEDVRPKMDKYEFNDEFNHDGNYYLVTAITQR